MIGPYKYTINIYNDINEKEEKYKGVTFARSILSATEKIVKYYGEDCIIDIYIYPLEEGEVYEFKPEEEKED